MPNINIKRLAEKVCKRRGKELRKKETENKNKGRVISHAYIGNKDDIYIILSWPCDVNKSYVLEIVKLYVSFSS